MHKRKMPSKKMRGKKPMSKGKKSMRPAKKNTKNFPVGGTQL